MFMFAYVEKEQDSRSLEFGLNRLDAFGGVGRIIADIIRFLSAAQQWRLNSLHVINTRSTASVAYLNM